MNNYNPNKKLYSQLKKLNESEKKISLSKTEENVVFAKYEGITNLPAYSHYRLASVNFEPINVGAQTVYISLQRPSRIHILGFMQLGNYHFEVKDEYGNDLTGGKEITPENVDVFFKSLYQSSKFSSLNNMPADITDEEMAETLGKNLKM